MLPTPRPTSPSSRGSRRCASGPACTSVPPVRPGSTTSSGRSSTTRSTRPWRAAPPGSTSPCWPTAAAGSATTGPGSRSARTRRTPSSSTAEIVLTTLHAGGKFGGKGYQVSGGLHGVGISVVNALSTRLLLEVDRDGQHWEAEFEKGGKVKKKVTATGPAPKDRSTGEARTGTTVTFWPDGTSLRRDRVPGADDRRTDADHGLLEQGPRDPLRRRAHRSRDQDDLPLQRRHRRLRQAPERVQGVVVPQGGCVRSGRGGPGGRDRAAVERRLPRVHPLLRQRHLHH